MGRLLNTRRLTLGAAMAALLLLGGVPLAAMLFHSFLTSSGGVGLENYTRTLGGARSWTLLFNSLILAGASTLVAGGMGIPLAIVAVKSSVPLRRTITAIFCLPLLFPPYVLANGWFRILGRQGLVYSWFGERVGAAASAWFFGLPGGVLVLSTAFLPIILLLSMASLSSVNPTLEDAASLFCRWPRILRSITLPLARPGIALSVLLAFLLSLGEFAAPSFLRVAVFPAETFAQFSAFYDSAAATAAAVPLAFVTFLTLSLVQRWIGPGSYCFRWTRAAANPLPLGPWAPWLSAFALTLATLFVVLPCAALVRDGLSAVAFLDAWNRASDSLFWSLLYSAVAASVIVVLGFFLGYASHDGGLPGAGGIGTLTLILFALPGTLLAIGLIGAANRSSLSWLYASPALLLVGFVVQYAAIGERGIAAGLAQIAPAMEEAAQIAGAGWCHRIRAILVPLLKPHILSVWILAFIFCLRDASIPLLLSPPGRDPLTARTLTLMANGSPELIAALCLFSIALPVLPAAAAFFISKGGRA